jgi:5-methylcytosine-specific restriction endonuclease McrA
MEATQKCTHCGRTLPLTREFFGSTPSKGFRRKCRNCVAAHVKAHDQAHPEQAKARSATRQARAANVTGSYTRKDVEVIRAKQRDKCAYCGTDLSGKGAIDHMTPIALEGSNSPSNLALACEQCNFEKHAKTVAQYYIWRLEHGLPVAGIAFAKLRTGAP